MNKQKTPFVLAAVILMLGIWLFPSISQAKKEVASPIQIPEKANPQCIKPHPFFCPEQREGYSQSFIIETNSPLIEVPQGKCYVLLRLYARVTDFGDFDGQSSVWTLTTNGQMFLDELSLSADPSLQGSGISSPGMLKEDFPDKCVVVKSGETLGILKNESISKLSITLIGYFYNTPGF